MIPRHRPPFGPATLLNLGLRGAVSGNSVEDLEQAVSDCLDVAHAVWLPSARYGITNAIQFTTASTADVMCPAFNCGAVHHAVQETGRRIRYADCANDSFLMSCESPDEAFVGHAVVLSEMFGHRFLKAALEQPVVSQAEIRVFDLAMAIPEPADMTRLMSNDVAVISFGLGKSLYAGWGGMALTQSAELAEDLRRRRELDLKHVSTAAQWKCFAKMIARTAAHEPWAYKQMRQQVARSGGEPSSAEFSTTSHEWHRPATKAHIAIALRNVGDMAASIAQKKRLAAEYARRLSDYGFEASVNHDVALSHYSIRVPSVHRDSLRTHLWNQGVDVGTLFPFPHHRLDEMDYPYAIAASQQVLNLPLSCQLRQTDVARICDYVMEFLPTGSVSSIANSGNRASKAA